MSVGFLNQIYQNTSSVRNNNSYTQKIGFKSKHLHSDVFQRTSNVSFSGIKIEPAALEAEKILKNIAVNNKCSFEEAQKLEELVAGLIAYNKLPNIGEGKYKTVFKMQGAENIYAVKVLKNELKSSPSFNVKYIQGKGYEKANNQINQRIIRMGTYSIDYFIDGKEVGLKNLNINNSLPREVLQNYYPKEILELPQEKVDAFAMITKKLHKQKKEFDSKNPNNFIINENINYVDDMESSPVNNIDSLLDPFLVIAATNNKSIYNADEKVLGARQAIFKKIVKAGIKADIDFKDFSAPCKSVYDALEITGHNKANANDFVVKINEIKSAHKNNPNLDVNKQVDDLFASFSS